VFLYTHIAFLLYDDEIKEAMQKWLYELNENVIRHLSGGIKQLVKECDKCLKNKWDYAETNITNIVKNFFSLISIQNKLP